MLNQIYQKDIHYFFDRRKNKVLIKEWLDKEEKANVKIIQNRLDRVYNGNYGDYKSVGNGILELRFKQGFRIYFTEVNNTIVLLFCGGDKSSQQKDIEKAKEYKAILDEKGLEYCVE